MKKRERFSCGCCTAHWERSWAHIQNSHNYRQRGWKWQTLQRWSWITILPWKWIQFTIELASTISDAERKLMFDLMLSRQPEQMKQHITEQGANDNCWRSARQVTAMWRRTDIQNQIRLISEWRDKGVTKGKYLSKGNKLRCGRMHTNEDACANNCLFWGISTSTYMTWV